jgi:hypothetical protein
MPHDWLKYDCIKNLDVDGLAKYVGLAKNRFPCILKNECCLFESEKMRIEEEVART